MNDAERDREYPGVGRLDYFLAQIGMMMAAVFVVVMFGPESRVMSFTGLVLMVASFVLDVLRLRNIGVSQWFAFLRYLPFGRLLLNFGLLSAQTGWNETRQLDSAGKSILAVELLLVGLMLFMYFRMDVVMFLGY